MTDFAKLAISICSFCWLVALYGQTSAPVGFFGRAILVVLAGIATVFVVAWPLRTVDELRAGTMTWLINVCALCVSTALLAIHHVMAFQYIYSPARASTGNAAVDVLLIALSVILVMLFALSWPALLPTVQDQLPSFSEESAVVPYVGQPNAIDANPRGSTTGGSRRDASRPVVRTPRSTSPLPGPDASLPAQGRTTSRTMMMGVLALVAVTATCVAGGTAIIAWRSSSTTPTQPVAATATQFGPPLGVAPTSPEAAGEIASSTAGAAPSSSSTNKSLPDVEKARKGKSRAPP